MANVIAKVYPGHDGSLTFTTGTPSYAYETRVKSIVTLRISDGMDCLQITKMDGRVIQYFNMPFSIESDSLHINELHR